jgi:hypothetical protein
MEGLEKGKGMTMKVRVDLALLAETITELQHGGPPCTEHVVLWLAKRADPYLAVKELFLPEQEAAADYFHIPRRAMAPLMEHLREQGLMVAAQLHTHPREAFHSSADDRWAIVRHIGALSIVLPEFGLTTTPQNFCFEAKLFVLNQANRWMKVSTDDHLEIAP